MRAREAGPALLVAVALVLPGSLGATSSQVAEQASDTVVSAQVAGEERAGHDPIRLTLEEAIRRAEQNNPGYRQATFDLERNVLDRRDQWLSVLPQPQINYLTTSMGWSRQTVTEDIFGEPEQREVVETVQTSRSRQALGLTLSLSLGDFLDFRRQEDQAQMREYSTRNQLLGLRADVRQAFLDVQEQEVALELERELLEMARVNRDAAERLYALARRDRIDLVSLELDLAEQENALEESRRQLESARLGLRNLIGDPGLQEFEIVPTEIELFDPTRMEVEALVRVAQTSSPDVLRAEAGLRAEEHSISQLRSQQWLPTISASWGTSRQGFVRGGDAFFDVNPDAAWDRSMSVSVSFPDLGQYLQRHNQQRRNELAVREQEESLRQTRNQLEQDVRSLVNELVANARSLEIQERRTALASEQVELAREQYRLGQLSYLELQGAQEQAAQSGRQAVAARFAFERARIALERSMGMTVDEMIELDGGR